MTPPEREPGPRASEENPAGEPAATPPKLRLREALGNCDVRSAAEKLVVHCVIASLKKVRLRKRCRGFI